MSRSVLLSKILESKSKEQLTNVICEVCRMDGRGGVSVHVGGMLVYTCMCRCLWITCLHAGPRHSV